MLGFALPQFARSARDDLVRFASSAQDLGAASLWVGDRLLADNGYPDAFVALNYVATGIDAQWVQQLLAASAR